MQFCPHVFMLRKNYLTKHMFINDHTSPLSIYKQYYLHSHIYSFCVLGIFLPTSYSLYGLEKKLSVTPSYIKSVIKIIQYFSLHMPKKMSEVYLDTSRTITIELFCENR